MQGLACVSLRILDEIRGIKTQKVFQVSDFRVYVDETYFSPASKSERSEVFKKNSIGSDFPELDLPLIGRRFRKQSLRSWWH